MPTLIDLRRRIQSVRNSQQITQAMKTVSTAKFRKAQRTVQEARPFWHLFPELMGRLAYWASAGAHPLLLRRDEKKVEVIVITADKGLAGAYNSNLLAAADAFLAKKAAAAEVRLVLIGKKAVAHLRKGPYPVDRSFGDRTDRLSRDDLRGLAEELMRDFTFQKIDAVYIVSNEFKSILAPRIMTHKVLPIEPKPGPEASATWLPDWEPGDARLAAFILPLFVESQIHHAFHESQAAEQAARMMAMDNATKNAEELIEDLVLQLNKIRQAGITKELLEIMTAVEALKQKD
ncbi:MAG: ATP synthase F1 subunit gamma [Candidatus Aminicenantes bacterium]|nr:MAG: ATP synthase F1 subunit gamma [Candidatus Aminicenantes bacterium]RPJ02675.1 MAG: ATP synthase F1 subunit gamma [Candidatus Aminicenantes bacterium]